MSTLEKYNFLNRPRSRAVKAQRNKPVKYNDDDFLTRHIDRPIFKQRHKQADTRMSALAYPNISAKGQALNHNPFRCAAFRGPDGYYQMICQRHDREGLAQLLKETVYHMFLNWQSYYNRLKTVDFSKLEDPKYRAKVEVYDPNMEVYLYQFIVTDEILKTNKLTDFKPRFILSCVETSDDANPIEVIIKDTRDGASRVFCNWDAEKGFNYDDLEVIELTDAMDLRPHYIHPETVETKEVIPDTEENVLAFIEDLQKLAPKPPISGMKNYDPY